MLRPQVHTQGGIGPAGEADDKYAGRIDITGSQGISDGVVDICHDLFAQAIIRCSIRPAKVGMDVVPVFFVDQWSECIAGLIVSRPNVEAHQQRTL